MRRLTGLAFGARVSYRGPKLWAQNRRLLFPTFLSQQSFGYCPHAKRTRSHTGAGVVGDLFETAHNAIAPMWQPRAYIRSCEVSSVVERTHGNLARKTKGWVEHEFHHTVENSRGIIAVPAARCGELLVVCHFRQGRSYSSNHGAVYDNGQASRSGRPRSMRTPAAGRAKRCVPATGCSL